MCPMHSWRSLALVPTCGAWDPQHKAGLVPIFLFVSQHLGRNLVSEGLGSGPRYGSQGGQEFAT